MIRVFVLLGVAFVTLFERKLLGLSQTRLGPNKVRAKGLFQPLLDGLKLIIKEDLLRIKRFKRLFYFAPFCSFIIIVLIWFLVGTRFSVMSLEFSLLLLLRLIGLIVYFLLLSG